MESADRSPVFATVVIPTCQRPEMLAACLERLAPSVQTTMPEPFEVVVSDDGSTASARETVNRFPFAVWRQGPRRGPAANRNNGARGARGRWLLFTDDDCLPDPDWVGAFFRAAGRSPSVSVFEGRTYADRPRRTLEETAPVNETGGMLWSCNLALQREAFEALGGFQERFPYATVEDMEFRLRIDKAHLATEFVAAASVCHPWRPVPRTWTASNRFCESFQILLDLHPDQLEVYRPGTFLRRTVGSFVRDTVPMLLKAPSGLVAAILRHGGELRLETMVTKRHAAQVLARARQILFPSASPRN
jgi:GT2 family glycosyltransferase